MLSSQEEQIERRRVFAQDQSLPKQATTFHQHALADAQTPRGRFSAVEASYVVGTNPTIDYPAGPAWCADPGSQCVEPPLGLDNPALDYPSSAVLHPSPAEQLGPTSDAPSPLGQRDVGSFSSDDPTTGGLASPSASPRGARGLVGSSPFRRRV
jgi:hypothetical protein